MENFLIRMEFSLQTFAESPENNLPTETSAHADANHARRLSRNKQHNRCKVSQEIFFLFVGKAFYNADGVGSFVSMTVIDFISPSFSTKLSS